MPESSSLAVLGIGFFLGLRHATDPDHVIAVTTFLGKERRLLRACSIGVWWGLGHTLALTVVGLLVVGLRTPVPHWLAERLEFLVAAMLIVLGARLMTTVHARWHGQRHDSDGRRLGLRTVLVGLVHGAAGSAAVTLLVLSTASTVTAGLLYILVFGIGSMLGMLAVSVALSLPLRFAARRLDPAMSRIQISMGLLSCAFGIYLAADLWLNLS